jgi:hypothetical protein
LIARLNYNNTATSKWTDNISDGLGTGRVVCVQTVSQYVSAAPSVTANSTMPSKFSLAVTRNNSEATISAQPTLCEEIGNYNITTDSYITKNPASTATCNIPVWVIYAIQIVQKVDTGRLQDKTWIISFT